MQSVAKLILIVSISLLTSCFIGPVKELKIQIEDSWQDDSIPENPTPLNDAPAINSTKLWEQSLGSKTDDNLEFSICDNKLFIASSEGSIFSINPFNGNISWEKNINTKIIAGVSCNKKNIFFVTEDGFVQALDHQGEVLWRVLVGQIYSKPFVQDNSLIVKTISNEFVSLNADTGNQNWIYRSPSPPLTLRSWGKINASEGIIFAGLPSGKCLALDLNSGALLWETTFSQPKGSTDIDRANDTTSQPVVVGPFLFVVASKGNLAMLDKKTGEVFWTRALSSFYELEKNNESIFVVHNSGAIYSVSMQTSKVNWRNSEYLNRNIRQVTLLNKNIIVGDYDGFLHYVDIVSGKTIGREKISSTSIINIKLVENKLIIHDSSNNLFSFLMEDDKIDLSNHNNSNHSNKIIDNEETSKVIQSSEQEESFLDELIFWD